MFAKLLAVILTFGVIGCVLLVNRQQQIEAEHEMTVIHRRLVEQDRAIWRLRAEIARASSPDELHVMKSQLALDWKPILIGGTAFRAVARIYGSLSRSS